MRKYIIFLAFFSVFFPLIAFSADRTITCGSPEGTRVDYFMTNAMNIENEKFLMSRDRMEKADLQIILKENNQDVIFKIKDASSNMKILLSDADQISFSGLFNGAPILATFYPAAKILIYSQQSSWPGGQYIGARAVIFYAKCKE